MARLLATLFVLTLTVPLHAQPIPAGGEVRVRGAEDTPWVLGLFARHDSTTLTMTYAGTERVYELASLERVEWHTDWELGKTLAISGGVGIGLGLVFGLLFCGSDSWGDCTVGESIAWGAAAGLAGGLVQHAIDPKTEWRNVTKHYPPAGSSQ